MILVRNAAAVAPTKEPLDKTADWGLYPSITLTMTANFSWVKDLYQITHQAGPDFTVNV